MVVVSGDVYDRALPHVDAVALADEAFARLAASRARVVVSSGNHDSARRLGFGSRLMDAAGVFVRTDASSVGTPVVLADQHGDVAIHAIPYLDPSALLEPWALGRRSHEAALSEAMTRVRSDLAARPASTRSVVLAHAFVAGATPSESERDISVGGVSRVATSLFDDIDYTALGHLHGPHVLDRAAALLRLPAGLLLLRVRPGQGLVARRPRRHRVRVGDLGRRTGPTSTGPALRHARPAARRPVAHHPRGRLGAGHPDRRPPPVARHGAAAPTIPPHAGPAVPDPHRRRPHRSAARARHERPRHLARLRRHVRGSDATPGEAALLREAIDACCHDPDQDVLVGAPLASAPRPARGAS